MERGNQERVPKERQNIQSLDGMMDGRAEPVYQSTQPESDVWSLGKLLKAKSTGLEQNVLLGATFKNEAINQQNQQIVHETRGKMSVIAIAKDSLQRFTAQTQRFANLFKDKLIEQNKKYETATVDNFASNVITALAESLSQWPAYEDKIGVHLVGYALKRIANKDYVIGFAPKGAKNAGAVVVGRGDKSITLAGTPLTEKDRKAGVIGYKVDDVQGMQVTSLELHSDDQIIVVGDGESLAKIRELAGTQDFESSLVEAADASSHKETAFAVGAQYGFTKKLSLFSSIKEKAKDNPGKTVGVAGAGALALAVLAVTLGQGLTTGNDKGNEAPATPSVPAATATPTSSAAPTMRDNWEAGDGSADSKRTAPATAEDAVQDTVNQAKDRTAAAKNAAEAAGVVTNADGSRHIVVTKWNKDKPNEPGDLYNIAGIQLRNVPDFGKLPTEVQAKLKDEYVKHIRRLNPQVKKYIYEGNKIKLATQDEVNAFTAKYLADHKKDVTEKKAVEGKGFEAIGQLALKETKDGVVFTLADWRANMQQGSVWGNVDSILSAMQNAESTDEATQIVTGRVLKDNGMTWKSARLAPIGREILITSTHFEGYIPQITSDTNPYDFFKDNAEFMKWQREHPNTTPYNGKVMIEAPAHQVEPRGVQRAV